MVTELQSAQSSRHRGERGCELSGERGEQKQISAFLSFTRLSESNKDPLLQELVLVGGEKYCIVMICLILKLNVS